ncbi:MAG: histidinol-phosphate transaminase [Atribacterota bacterium]|nr:histidinol-phosphate transaminase [Atribacterota bacterium]MDD5636691.1 histidinol-phosphate transaminase [Atribacterota bacterium]
MLEAKHLTRKGILDLKPYIPGKPIEEVQRELGLKEVVKLASNETSLGPSPLAVEAIEREIKNINFYPEGTSRVLREKLAKKLNISEDFIIVGNGADNIIDLTGMAFINQGDEVITSETTFPAYETITKIMGGEFVTVGLKDFCFDLEGITERITGKTKMIYLCNPNNPTGTIVKTNSVEKMIRQIPEDVIVIFDEAYYDYVEDKDYPDSLSYVLDGKNVIILRTFSKIAGIAGVRIGYGIAKPELIGYLRRVVNPFTTNRLAQVAALASLDDEIHYQQVLKVNKEGKQYLYQELDKLNLFYLPTETNFIFIDLKEDSQLFFEKCLRKGVIIRPGKIYGTPTFIRVTIGTHFENEKFIQVLTEIIR